MISVTVLSNEDHFFLRRTSAWLASVGWVPSPETSVGFVAGVWSTARIIPLRVIRRSETLSDIVSPPAWERAREPPSAESIAAEVALPQIAKAIRLYPDLPVDGVAIVAESGSRTTRG